MCDDVSVCAWERISLVWVYGCVIRFTHGLIIGFYFVGSFLYLIGCVVLVFTLLNNLYCIFKYTNTIAKRHRDTPAQTNIEYVKKKIGKESQQYQRQRIRQRCLLFYSIWFRCYLLQPSLSRVIFVALLPIQNHKLFIFILRCYYCYYAYYFNSLCFCICFVLILSLLSLFSWNDTIRID